MNNDKTSTKNNISLYKYFATDMSLKNTPTIFNSTDNNLIEFKKLIYDACGLSMTNFKIEAESQEYKACTFELNNLKIKYRVSKITPTKTGQFVTIWKRNDKGITEPFHQSDDFDFIIITSKSENNMGQFMFPKHILIQQKIISTNLTGGKRGIRVYPPWEKVTSKQAEKTQKWQNEYFVTLCNNNSFDIIKIKQLLNQIK